VESKLVEFSAGFPSIVSIKSGKGFFYLFLRSRHTEFLAFIFSGLTYNQLNNNLTSQAATMQTNGLPNDVLSNLDPFALIILIPICDIIVKPPFFRSFFLQTD